MKIHPEVAAILDDLPLLPWLDEIVQHIDRGPGVTSPLRSTAGPLYNRVCVQCGRPIENTMSRDHNGLIDCENLLLDEQVSRFHLDADQLEALRRQRPDDPTIRRSMRL